MPFASLMTDILKRQENRDIKKNHSEEYIKVRTQNEMLWLLNSLLIVFSFLIYVVGQRSNIQIIPAVMLFLIMIFCFWKFLSSCLYK